MNVGFINHQTTTTENENLESLRKQNALEETLGQKRADQKIQSLFFQKQQLKNERIKHMEEEEEQICHEQNETKKYFSQILDEIIEKESLQQLREQYKNRHTIYTDDILFSNLQQKLHDKYIQEEKEFLRREKEESARQQNITSRQEKLEELFLSWHGDNDY